MVVSKWLAQLAYGGDVTAVHVSKGFMCNVPQLIRKVDAGEGKAALKGLCLYFLQGGRETNLHQAHTVRESVHIKNVQ